MSIRCITINVKKLRMYPTWIIFYDKKSAYKTIRQYVRYTERLISSVVNDKKYEDSIVYTSYIQ